MMNMRNFILTALLPIGAIALTACIEPVVIGGNGGGGNGGGGNNACMTDSECAAGQVCQNGVCAPGNNDTCNGQPSPLSCTQTGCPMGQICVPDPDPNACYPSACGCDPATGTWQCTADCGQGSHCVQSQGCGPNAECPPNSVCDANGMCVPVCSGTPEVCNGVDDDCDGAIDEQSDPALPICPDGTACVMGQCGGVNVPCMSDSDCGPMQLCINGVCGGGSGCSTEVCNGIDDDCNGLVDDGPGAICADGTACVNGGCGGQVQQCGPNLPPCPMGQFCTPNGVCSSGGCQPTMETCNGADDDCNGVVDDGAGAFCPNGGLCVNGTCGGVLQCGPNSPCPAGQQCVMGICQGGGCQPAPEMCNGVDDDCDGSIDEATPGAILCQQGACINGQCQVVQCGPNTPCPMGLSCLNGICK